MIRIEYRNERSGWLFIGLRGKDPTQLIPSIRPEARSCNPIQSIRIIQLKPRRGTVCRIGPLRNWLPWTPPPTPLTLLLPSRAPPPSGLGLLTLAGKGSRWSPPTKSGPNTGLRCCPRTLRTCSLRTPIPIPIRPLRGGAVLSLASCAGLRWWPFSGSLPTGRI